MASLTKAERHYKLIEPVKKPLSERIPFYFFACILSLFLLWIMLIRPMMLPADKMPFIFAYNKDTHEVYPEQQKREYFLWTGGAILAAGLIMIPTIRRSNRYDYALAKIYANRMYMSVEEHVQLCGMLNTNMIKDNGANKALVELQHTVDKNDGKDTRPFKPEYLENLELQ